MQLVLFPGQLWEELNQTQNHARAVFTLTMNDLLLSAVFETLKLCYMAIMAIQCLPAEMVIQSECTFWLFLCLSLIPGGQGLIQTERYTFHRQYSWPCFFLVNIIFGVSSESGVISHTLPHVLTPVLFAVVEVSILLCLQITLLSFGNTHGQSNLSSHELRQTGGLSERD